jgi:hypothetical protein
VAKHQTIKPSQATHEQTGENFHFPVFRFEVIAVVFIKVPGFKVFFACDLISMISSAVHVHSSVVRVHNTQLNFMVVGGILVVLYG